MLIKEEREREREREREKKNLQGSVQILHRKKPQEMQIETLEKGASTLSPFYLFS